MFFINPISGWDHYIMMDWFEYQHGLPLISAWITNRTLFNLWGEITYELPNLAVDQVKSGDE